ncbi:hypothetical protein QJS10_CPB20g02012 [Acorus calamus]|uniref:Uncharacterized protein n=1 Tax=Acorus calamus TaxID=4465 RepID=A0AAV9CA54_ACOCL|nr:hypothetical protein QJS10_CPB20g02012 [Acorus calamus]
MGNCLKTCKHGKQQQQEEEDPSKVSGFDEKGGSGGGGGLKVKIVLTKAELEWLMFELEGKEKGGKRLEEVLEEIEKGREKGKVHGWKPSLQSIMESP